MPRKIGLWQWHRALTEGAKCLHEARPQWWTGHDEMESARNLIAYETCPPGYGKSPVHPYRGADALERCAVRAIRRYQLPVKTAREWNKLVRDIGRRADMHHMSIKAACVPREDLNRPVYFDEKGNVRVVYERKELHV